MAKLHYRARLRLNVRYQPIAPKDSDGLVYRAELMRRLGISEGRIDAYLQRGLLPFKTGKAKGSKRNRRYKYDVAEVKARLKEIDRLQRRGLPLDRIKEILDGKQ